MIVTFYSFKGGVGRSMALANVGRWFQLCGLNVVVVDWDLEAPGLETFFSNDPAVLRSWRDRVGLTDLLLLYRQDHPTIQVRLPSERRQETASSASHGETTDDNPAQPDAAAPQRELTPNERWNEIVAQAASLGNLLPPLKFALIDVAAPPDARDAGQLRILTAGWREGARFAAYANAVQSFDWNEFYAAYHGHAYFEWLRTSLDNPDIADIVLIDSRTGVTEMGGVSTRQFADVVVVCVAPNDQNVDGAMTMTQSFKRDKLLEQRGQRPIRVVMVPSRIDVGSSENKKEFEAKFRARANAIMPKELDALKLDFSDLRIPYIAKFAFRERLSIGERDGDPDLDKAYRSIGAAIAWLAPDAVRANPAIKREFDRVFGADRVRSATDFGAQFEYGWHQIPEPLQSDAKEVLIRLVELSLSVTEPNRARPLPEDELIGRFRDAIDAAEQAGLVTRVRAGVENIAALQLAEPEYATQSELERWIKDDLEFLQWRQALRASFREWQTKGRDPSRLLRGRALDEAEERAKQADRNELLDDERQFIETSLYAGELTPRAIQIPSAYQPPPAVPHGAAEITRETGVPNVVASPPGPTRSSRSWIAAAAIAVLAVGGLVSYLAVRGGKPPTNVTTNAAADSLLAGRQFAADSNYAAAIAAYTATLRLDNTSVDARRYRAEAELASGQPDRALADLDTAITMAPSDLKLRSQRAQVRWTKRDAQGALADVEKIPPDSMDNATLRLRADLYSAAGQDSAALGAYAAVVQRGDSAAGQLGRGRALEKLGNRTAAVQAYRVAARVATDPSVRNFAQTRLRVLAPTDTVAPVQRTRVYLSLSTKDDAAIAAPIDSSLRRERLPGLTRQSTGLFGITTVSTIGEIRFYNASDQALASKVLGATESALASVGVYQKLTVRLMPPTSQQARPAGTIEIVLPSLYPRSAK